MMFKNILVSLIKYNLTAHSANKIVHCKALSTLPSEFIDLNPGDYEKVSSETLESLSDYFEEIVERADNLIASDVAYGDGVLTVNFGTNYGTYVINRQSPNKQIWLSSPTSGPKRYDFFGNLKMDQGKWIYKHTGESLHEILQKEIQQIVKEKVDFFKLPYSKV